jgi:hypothetical protein
MSCIDNFAAQKLNDRKTLLIYISSKLRHLHLWAAHCYPAMTVIVDNEFYFQYKSKSCIIFMLGMATDFVKKIIFGDKMCVCNCRLIV